MPSYFSNKFNLLYIPESPVDDGFGNLILNKLKYDLIAVYWMEADLEHYWLTGEDLLAYLQRKLK